MEVKFKKCARCGQMVAMVTDKGLPVSCCGEPMQDLVPCSTDAAVEKHVPAYTVDGGKVCVQVGDVIHPMAEDHYIEWILLQTSSGNQRKQLKPGDEPKACFAIGEGDTVEAVYAYCNLHGLWKA